MKLCLLVSRRCNLRCGFCRVEFTGRDMEWETARTAVENFIRWAPREGGLCVKFFGGEPLLNFGVISRLVDAAASRWADAGLRFELPTNGSFLDAEKVRYFRGHPEVDVTVSGPAPSERLPGVCFTLVLDPRSRPEETLARVGELLRAGYRRFNFLPAYYVVWTPSQVARLRRSFAALARLFERLEARGDAVEVKNLRVFSEVPLYNDALTVDADGTLYASNMFQCEGMEPYRERLRLGRLEDASEETFRRRLSSGALPAILREWAGPDRWRSTQAVDGALTEFVRRLSKN